jgi:hypothetical protein
VAYLEGNNLVSEIWLDDRGDLERDNFVVIYYLSASEKWLPLLGVALLKGEYCTPF